MIEIELLNKFYRLISQDVIYHILGKVDVWNKIKRFNRMIGTIKRTLRNNVMQEKLLTFYRVMSIPSCLCGMNHGQ